MRALLSLLVGSCLLACSSETPTGPDAGGNDAGADTFVVDSSSPTDGGGADADSGGCGDTQTDPKNCGACGHDCGGAACSAGLCAPTTLVTGKTVTGIAVDSVNVYFTHAIAQLGTVERCAKSGCSGQAGGVATSQDNPTNVTADGVTVFWTNNGAGDGVMKCPIGGCGGAATKLAADNNPFGIASDATDVYWTNGSSVLKCAKTGCSNSPTTLASGTGSPVSIAVDSTNVYFSNEPAGTIMACAINGCNNAPTVLASNQTSPESIATDGVNVYWTNTVFGTGSVLKCAVTGCNNQPTVLSSPESSPRSIATDGTNVYWATVNQIRRCASGGCAQPLVLGAGTGPLAIDSTSIYWADASGNVQKLAK